MTTIQQTTTMACQRCHSGRRLWQ